VFGAKPVVAMSRERVDRCRRAWAAHDLLRRATSRCSQLPAGWLVALHPALVPYTAALMTEGVAAALLVVAAAFAERAHRARWPGFIVRVAW